jgi:hypothetical protein
MKMRSVMIAAIAALLLFAGLAPARTLDIVVLPGGDAVFNHYHYSGGGGNDWYPGANPNSASYSYSGPPADVSDNTTYAQYSLSALGAGENVVSAFLMIDLLSVYNGYGDAIGAANIYHRTDASTANGNAMQALGGDALVGLVSTQPLGWTSFDITSFLQADKAAGYNWSAFSFNFTANGYGFSAMSFGSGENASQASYLHITTDAGSQGSDTPEPRTLALMALGGIGLAGMRMVRGRRSRTGLGG